MQSKTIKKVLTYALALVACLPVVIFLSVSTKAQTVTQGFASDTPLEQGMIVRLDPKDLTKVEPVNSGQANQIRGVVISASDSALLLGSTSSQVYVATTGRFTVLVSDQNGNIKTGDYITASSISGIGMKADNSQPTVVGKAMDSFSGSDNNLIIGTASVKTSNGHQQQIHLGQVLVDISIGPNPLLQINSALPGIFRNASTLLVGKPVSPARIYLSLAIIAASAIISGSLIYSGVRNSLIAIGRNPLSKKLILRSLLQVVIISLMIFMSGIFGVYLLLKL